MMNNFRWPLPSPAMDESRSAPYNEEGEPPVPDYGGACVTRLVPALLDGPEVEDGWPSWLPDEIGEASRVLLLVLDGLGWRQLWEHSSIVPTMLSLSAQPISTVAPTTTAAALTSISTGLPPGEHGVVGYRMAVALQGEPHDEVLNALRWTTRRGDARNRHDPLKFQTRTLFQGQRPPVVTREEFLGSGFTAAHLSDTRLIGYRDRKGLVAKVVEAFERGEAFVYAYWDAIDRIAHEFGLTDRYEEELATCDAMINRLLERLPAGTAVVVTSDHGQVHVGDEVLEISSDLGRLVAGQSGEARFRWLHAVPGEAAELTAAATEVFSQEAWVISRDRMVEGGWLGPVVTDAAWRRLGDVALVARSAVAFVDPNEYSSIQLISRHGGLSNDELEVPVICSVS